MRVLRFAAVILALAGCFGPSERQRRPPAQSAGSGGSVGTGGGAGGGTGGAVETEPDAAVGGAGDELDAAPGGTTGTDSSAGPDTRRDAAADGRPVDAARDSVAPEAPPRDAAADARADAARDVAAEISPPDTALPDAAADTAPPDAATGDPEPGRLAGITRFHNQVRATIPVPDLTWDTSVAATAATAAARCLFEHSGTQGVGENLAAFAPPGGRSASAPVDGWADEKADYDYASNSCVGGRPCGHYTQMVWKTSLRLGCAVQACSQNSPFGGSVTNWELWVCQYTPPGNLVGRKPY